MSAKPKDTTDAAALSSAETQSPDKKKPITAKQRRARQANARKSRGPTTPAGKNASRQNATKHGVWARLTCTRRTAVSDPGEFAAVLRNLLDEYRPVSQEEVMEVEDLAFNLFQKQRLLALRDSAGDPTQFNTGCAGTEQVPAEDPRGAEKELKVVQRMLEAVENAQAFGLDDTDVDVGEELVWDFLAAQDEEPDSEGDPALPTRGSLGFRNRKQLRGILSGRSRLRQRKCRVWCRVLMYMLEIMAERQLWQQSQAAEDAMVAKRQLVSAVDLTRLESLSRYARRLNALIRENRKTLAELKAARTEREGEGDRVCKR